MILPFDGATPDIDPSAFVHPMATIIGRVKIGPRSSIWPGAVLRGDEGSIVIGELTNIQDGAVIHSTHGLSEVVVGDRVTVGHNAILHGCTVGCDLVVGMGSTVLDNAVLEDGCFLGANSLVAMGKTIPAGMLALGYPAKVLKRIGEEQRMFIELAAVRYWENAQKHRLALREAGIDLG